MKRIRFSLVMGLLALLALLFVSGAALSADSVTVTGTINEYIQIVTEDGDIFDVTEGEKGDELIDLVDKNVRVTGVVEDYGGAKTITVSSYEVLGD